MNVYEAAIRRRSIRRYQDKPVPYDVLKKCVDTARLAPSARNAQVCEYIIVDDGKLLPEISAAPAGPPGSADRRGSRQIAKSGSTAERLPEQARRVV